MDASITTAHPGYDRGDEPDKETKSDDGNDGDDKSSCESETEVVEGVQGKSSALQSSIHPPANLWSTKSKGTILTIEATAAGSEQQYERLR